jgi:hypothetical protein
MCSFLFNLNNGEEKCLLESLVSNIVRALPFGTCPLEITMSNQKHYSEENFLISYFLVQLSWKLKWVFLIVRRPSVNFYIFYFFSRTIGPILTRLGTNQSWGEGIQVCSNKGDSPSPRGNNSEWVKIYWNFLKIFSRASRPNPIKLDTNYPWVKGIQVSSNEGTFPLQRGDNHRNAKIGWVFSSTIGPEKLKFTWKLSDIVQKQVC